MIGPFAPRDENSHPGILTVRGNSRAVLAQFSPVLTERPLILSSLLSIGVRILRIENSSGVADAYPQGRQSWRMVGSGHATSERTATSKRLCFPVVSGALSPDCPRTTPSGASAGPLVQCGVVVSATTAQPKRRKSARVPADNVASSPASSQAQAHATRSGAPRSIRTTENSGPAGSARLRPSTVWRPRWAAQITTSPTMPDSMPNPQPSPTPATDAGSVALLDVALGRLVLDHAGKLLIQPEAL